MDEGIVSLTVLLPVQGSSALDKQSHGSLLVDNSVQL